MKDKSSIVTLRLDLSEATKYYFHPLADGVYKRNGAFVGFTNRVYYADEMINSQNPTSIKQNYARQLMLNGGRMIRPKPIVYV